MTGRASRIRRSVRGLATLVLVFALAALCAEAGFRGVERARGQPYSSGATLERIETLRDVEQRAFESAFVRPADAAQPQAELDSDPEDRGSERLLHPYFGYSQVSQIEALQTAVDRAAAGLDRETLDIAVLGGSVAVRFGKKGTGRLAEIVAEHTPFEKRDVRVLVLALGGYKQPQQLIQLLYVLELGIRPDVVLNLDGLNEVAIAVRNVEAGAHPIYPSIAPWTHLRGDPPTREALDLMLAARNAQLDLVRLADRMVRWRLHRSCILGRLGLGRLEELKETATAHELAYAAYLVNSNRERPPMLVFRDREDTVTWGVELWKDSSRLMHELCRARSIPYLHVLQPTLHDAGSKPLTAREVERGKSMGAVASASVRRGYPLLRAAGRDLAREGIGFVDASMAFAEVEETLYVDAGHTVPRGSEIIAETIAPALIAALRGEPEAETAGQR